MKFYIVLLLLSLYGCGQSYDHLSLDSDLRDRLESRKIEILNRFLEKDSVVIDRFRIPFRPKECRLQSLYTVTSYGDADESLYNGTKVEAFDMEGLSLGFYRKDFLEQIQIDGSGLADGVNNSGLYIHYDFDNDVYYLENQSIGAFGTRLNNWTSPNPSIAINPSLPQGTKIKFVYLGKESRENPKWVNQLLLSETFVVDDRFFGEDDRKIDVYVGLQQAREPAGRAESLFIERAVIEICDP